MSDAPDIDGDLPRGTQILWGRVLVLVLALALAFWLGTTFGDDSASRREIRDQRNEIARLEAQIAAMEAEMAAIDAGGAQQQASDPASEGISSEPTARERRRQRRQRSDGGGNAGGGGAGDADDANSAGNGSDGDDDGGGDDGDGGGNNGGGDQQADAGGRTYVVQSGDSLASIAQEVYGDATRWREIAEANDLEEPFSLTVGEPLRIPDRE